MPLLDALDASAAAIDAVNTIVNDDGFLRGYNTDYRAVRELLQQRVSPSTPFVLLGSGGMAKAVASALRDAGFADGTIVARNAASGRALAARCGCAWQPQLGEVDGALLINTTPIGMSGATEAEALAFSPSAVAAAHSVFDVVALPEHTPLLRLARALGKPVISGAEVIVLQALEQFVLYTGVRPGAEQVAAAARFARG